MFSAISKFFCSIQNFLHPLILYIGCILSGPSHINDVMFHIYTDPFEDINCIKDKAGNKLPVPTIAKYYKCLLKDKNRTDLDLDDYSIEFLTKKIIDVGPDDYKLKAYYQNSGKENLFVYFYGVGKTMFWTSLTGNPYYTLKTNMEKDFDLLIPEYPGYGVNNFKNNHKNLDRMIDVYVKWIKEHYGGKNIIIGGHSFGCWLALKLANQLEGEQVNLILNNPFFNNQTSMITVAGATYGERLVKFLSSVEYENDKLIKNLEGRNVHVYLTPLRKDKICAYEDSVKLAKIGDYVHMIKVKDNSRKFKHIIHRYVNHEQNRWIAQNIVAGNFNFNQEDYELFKNSL